MRMSFSNLIPSKVICIAAYIDYLQLQRCKNNTGKALVGRGLNVVTSSNLVGAKRSRDSQSQKNPG